MVEYLENLLKNGPKYEINVCVIQDVKYYCDFFITSTHIVNYFY